MFAQAVGYLGDYFSGFGVMDWIGNGISAVASLILIASFQIKDYKKLIWTQVFTSFMFTASFVFLGAWAGMAQNLIGALMRIVYCAGDKYKWAKSRWWVAGFCAAIVTIGIITFDGSVLSVFPVISTCVYICVLWVGSGTWIRVAQLACVSPLWLCYNAYSKNVPGIFTEIFNMVSVIVSFIRFAVMSRKAKKTA